MVLGFAATVHRVQGMTVNDIIIKLDRSFFASGQAYVALTTNQKFRSDPTLSVRQRRDNTQAILQRVDNLDGSHGCLQRKMETNNIRFLPGPISLKTKYPIQDLILNIMSQFHPKRLTLKQWTSIFRIHNNQWKSMIGTNQCHRNADDFLAQIRAMLENTPEQEYETQTVGIHRFQSRIL